MKKGKDEAGLRSPCTWAASIVNRWSVNVMFPERQGGVDISTCFPCTSQKAALKCTHMYYKQQNKAADKHRAGNWEQIGGVIRSGECA